MAEAGGGAPDISQMMGGMQGILGIYSQAKQFKQEQELRAYMEALKRYNMKQLAQGNQDARKQALQGAVGAKTIFAPKEQVLGPQQGDFKVKDPLGLFNYI